jgi:Bacteriophage Sf6, terminase small subunit-like
VKLQHLCARRIFISVAVSNSVNGKPNAVGISRRPWTSKPRPKKEDKDLSQWPKGTTQPLTKVIASKLFSLISTSDDSLHGLLAKHPWLPPYRDLARWRKTQPWFASEWKTARQMQAEWLMQKALDLQKGATKETAHLCRVKFDIIKFIAGKLHPEVWGDRPVASTNVSTTVQVGVISPERLAELRNKLNQERQALPAAPPRLTPGNSPAW